MKIICAWCGLDMGDKAPFSNPDKTHGICPKCKTQAMEALVLYEKEMLAGKNEPRGSRA